MLLCNILSDTGVVIGSQGLDNHTIELFSNSYNLSIDCKAVSLVECYTVQYKWHKASKLISTNPKLVISNLKIEDAGQYQCTAFNSLGGLVSKTVYVDIKGKILFLLYVLMLCKTN